MSASGPDGSRKQTKAALGRASATKPALGGQPNAEAALRFAEVKPALGAFQSLPPEIQEAARAARIGVLGVDPKIVGQGIERDRIIQAHEMMKEVGKTVGFTSPIAKQLSELGAAQSDLRKSLEEAFKLGPQQEELAARIRATQDAIKAANTNVVRQRVEPIRMPPSPILETNRLLLGLGERVEALHGVFGQIVQIQEGQSNLITQLLQAANEARATQQAAHEAQEKVADKTLRIARAGLWIAGASLFATLLSVIASAL